MSCHRFAGALSALSTFVADKPGAESAGGHVLQRFLDALAGPAPAAISRVSVADLIGPSRCLCGAS